MAEFPAASLREVARAAGVSPATASDVRKRLQRGEEPLPGQGGAGDEGARSRRVTRPRTRRATAPGALLEKLVRDPSLRHNEQGRLLLRLLQYNAVEAEWPEVAAAVPPHCAVLVGRLARLYAHRWQRFAQELEDRARVVDPWSTRRAHAENLPAWPWRPGEDAEPDRISSADRPAPAARPARRGDSSGVPSPFLVRPPACR